MPSPMSNAVAQSLRAVTPSDSTNVGCRALYVGGTGDVVIIAYGDSSPVTLSAVPAGTILPIWCAKVMLATTATLLVGLF